MDQLESLELKISKFLRTGVILAGVFMLAGWLSQVMTQGESFEALHTYHEISLSESFKNSLFNHNWGEILSYIGLSVLISLPVIRVFLTAILFVRQKEYLLAGIASFVLMALVISFTLGIEL